MGCFGLLILGFVIFIIIRASNQNGNQTVKTASHKKNQMMANQFMRQNQPITNQSARQNRTAGGAAGYGQENRTRSVYTKSAEAAKQQELKNRLQLKYGGASLKPQKQQETQSVEKRKETNVVQLPEPPDEDLIQEINDLMVKGYEGEMTFSRDFVAEGIEMLNRIQM